MPLIWDQPQLPSLFSYGSAKAEENTISWLLLEKRTLPTSDHNITAFPESIFKNYMRFGKRFSSFTIWFQLGVASLIHLEITKEKRQP